MERIGSEVERELGRRGSPGANTLGEITSVWASAVGEAVARQAWPSRVARDGTLHVATSSATWAFELDRLSLEIQASLARLLSSEPPPRLRFRPGPLPEPGPATSRDARSPEPVDPPPEVVAEAERAAAAIADPELRQTVARAARVSLAKARSGR
jgi:hypothetical protein